MPWDPLVRVCVARPSYALMERAYRDYVADSAPCKNPDINNQCAVRMSVALGRCGFDLLGFPNRRRVHSGRPGCRLDVEHVVGARELADYLVTALCAPRRFSAQQADDARTALTGQHGIIYFNNCFRRSAGGPMVGDHIDLFDGSSYYNEVIRVSAGGDARSGTDLFHRADQVWFFALT
jgi:hypothetical protein